MAITDAAQRNHDQLFPGRVSTLNHTDPELIEYFDNSVRATPAIPVNRVGSSNSKDQHEPHHRLAVGHPRRDHQTADARLELGVRRESAESPAGHKTPQPPQPGNP